MISKDINTNINDQNISNLNNLEMITQPDIDLPLMSTKNNQKSNDKFQKIESVQFNIISYLRLMFQVLDFNLLIDQILINTIQSSLSVLIFLSQLIIYILCVLLICLMGSLDIIQKLNNNILNIIILCILFILYIIITIIFYYYASTSNSMSIYTTIVNSLILNSSHTKKIILSKIDLRSFGGDEEILSKKKVSIDIINDIVFTKIMIVVLLILPILLSNTLYLIYNFISVILSLFNIKIDIFSKLIFWLLDQSFGDPAEQIFTNLYLELIKIYSNFRILYILFLFIYMIIIVLSLVYMPKDTKNPKEFILSILDFSEKLLTSNIYNAQTKIAAEMNYKFLKSKQKWRYFLLSIMTLLSIIIVFIFYLMSQIKEKIYNIFKNATTIIPALLSWLGIIKNKEFTNYALYTCYVLAIIIIIVKILLNYISIIKDFQSISEIGNLFENIADAFIDLIDVKLDFNNYLSLSNHVDSIKLDNVSCGYDENMNILEDVSVSISTGKIIFIYGVSGAGKTTLFNAIRGVIYINKGSIMLSDGFNSQNLLSIFQKERSLIVSSVPQIIKFNSNNCTLKEYFLKSVPNSSEKDMINILIKLKLADNIDESKTFLNRNMGLDGEVFSGGQKSRIAVALALLKNSLISCIDESVDNLDINTTKIVISLLCGDDYTSNHIPVIVTHKMPQIFNILYELQTLEIFKKTFIWFVDDGKVTEYNVYELLQKGELNNLFAKITGFKIDVNDHEFLKHDIKKGGK